MNLARKTFARLLYPLTISGCLLLAYFQLYALEWHLLSIAAPLTLGFLIVGIMERVTPYRRTWLESHGDMLTDATYIGVNVALREVGNVVFKLGLLTVVGLFGVESISLGLWPVEWHPLLQVAAAILIFDFFEYWFHRASHTYGVLWRFHAVHHSPKRLYFFNAARFHFVDWLVLTAIEVLILLVIGADVTIVAMGVVFIQVHGLFQHSNIELKLGWLNYLVSGPELHRWHHSKLMQESDTNFGNNVIVWDLLFGTYFLPKDRHVGVTGLMNPDYPTGFVGQLKVPFTSASADKPADFYQREAFYFEQIEEENRRLERLKL